MKYADAIIITTALCSPREKQPGRTDRSNGTPQYKTKYNTGEGGEREREGAEIIRLPQDHHIEPATVRSNLTLCDISGRVPRTAGPFSVALRHNLLTESSSV